MMDYEKANQVVGRAGDIITRQAETIRDLRMQIEMGGRLSRYDIERAEQWDKRAGRMPYLRFDPEWEVAVIPPFAQAIARFVVKLGERTVSVYADFDNALGYYGTDEDGQPNPYWEIYPSEDGDVERFGIDDAIGLIGGIRRSFAALDQAATREGR